MIRYNTEEIYRFYRKNGGKLLYNTFKGIIVMNHQLLVKEMINTGYWYSVPHNIGLIRVVRNARYIGLNKNNNIHGAIDWKASNDLKEKFLSEGKTLYECKQDEEGNTISENDGEKWLVYRTDSHYYTFIMVKGVFLHNMMKYKYIPTFHNQRALVASITEDSELLYKEKSQNGTSRDFLLKCLNAAGRDYVWNK